MASGRDTKHGVLVGNPGGVPEFSGIVAGLARAEMLDAYVTSATASVGGPLGAIAHAPGPIGRSVQSALSRRQDPPGVSPDRIRHKGVWLELARVASRRIPPPRLAKALFARSLAFRNRRFDRALARQLNERHAAVIGAAIGSLSTFRRARELSVTSFLQYPIAHYLLTQRLLQEEASLQPSYAGTLQYETLPRRLLQRIDDEIAIADYIFAVSTFHGRSLLEAGVPEGKLVHIPLGVDPELFSPRPQSDDGRFRVIFVGKITQRKGISYLLDGFEAAALPDTELLLVGAPVGSTTPWRERPRVRHVPPRPRAELPALYATADVYVLPSLVEGFPLTALEAMACGLPVIVSEHTFAWDVVEDGVNGYVVPIRDARAIAERLRELHADPGKRAEMGRAARRTAEEFSWERYGERIATAVMERA